MPPVLIASASIVSSALLSGKISNAVALIALSLLGVVGWFAARYKIAELAQEQAAAATNVAAEWRSNYEAERERANEFERRYQEERALKHEAITKIASLELRTDQTMVLQALSDTQKALRLFHDEFLARDAEAAEMRARVVDTEARIVDQLERISETLTPR